MKKLDHGEVQLISRNSTINSEQVKDLLIDNVYNDKKSWHKFLQIFCISIGVGFLAAGIIFFFAYNWETLHKFAKLGIIQFLIIATVLSAFLLKINENLKSIILSGAALLFGALFAVFGQIYQTSADAYDFFLTWTISITIWVIALNFYPLWLIYIALINTTYILYTNQVVNDLNEVLHLFILFLINILFLVGFILKAKIFKLPAAPNWFLSILMLSSVIIGTAVVIYQIVDSYGDNNFYLLISLAIISSFIGGLYYGLQSRNLFYLAIIPIGFLSIISSLILINFQDGGSFLLVSLLIMISIGALSAKLINLQKKWKNEE